MTDLWNIIPDFPIQSYTHLIPSLEKNLVTTADLLTLDAVEIAKRAQLPTLDLKRLIIHIISTLHRDLGVDNSQDNVIKDVVPQVSGALSKIGNGMLESWKTISSLDPSLDAALGGGIPTGYITEITGESGAGKTQFLLTLLLSTQLPAPYGLDRSALYLSTEHPLPTTRLSQLLQTHPTLCSLQGTSKPSLARLLTLQIPDLETQDHVLAYQLPVVLRAQKIGLVVIDSIAANFRVDAAALSPQRGQSQPQSQAESLATRAADLARTGALLRQLAREHDCAIVVSNQVADRFTGPTGVLQHMATTASQRPAAWSSSPSEPVSQSQPRMPTIGGDPQQEMRHGWAVHPALSLDWQQRWFTGWGAEHGALDDEHAKTPALGLVWANQIACRVALVKEAAWSGVATMGPESAEWTPRKWRRWMRIAFAPWVEAARAGEKGVEFEIWAGGIRNVGKQIRSESEVGAS